MEHLRVKPDMQIQTLFVKLMDVEPGRLLVVILSGRP